MQQIIKCSEWSAHMIKLIKYHEEKTQYNMGYVDALDQGDCTTTFVPTAALTCGAPGRRALQRRNEDG